MLASWSCRSPRSSWFRSVRLLSLRGRGRGGRHFGPILLIPIWDLQHSRVTAILTLVPRGQYLKQLWDQVFLLEGESFPGESRVRHHHRDINFQHPQR